MTKKLSDFQKLLMKGLLGSDPRHVELMFLIHQMANCDQVLLWLYNQGYIGKALSDWITRDHGGDFMRAHTWLSSKFKDSHIFNTGKKPLII
jgi:hypothetical protein